MKEKIVSVTENKVVVELIKEEFEQIKEKQRKEG